jgi:hypothetical protein
LEITNSIKKTSLRAAIRIIFKIFKEKKAEEGV